MSVTSATVIIGLAAVQIARITRNGQSAVGPAPISQRIHTLRRRAKLMCGFYDTVERCKAGMVWSSKQYEEWAKANGVIMEGSLEACARCAVEGEYLVSLHPRKGTSQLLFLCTQHYRLEYPTMQRIYDGFHSAGFKKLAR